MAADQSGFDDIEGLLSWAYTCHARRTHLGSMRHEPGARSTDPTEPSGLERLAEGCGVRAIVNEQLHPLDRYIIHAEYLLPLDDVAIGQKEWAIDRLAGYYYMRTKSTAPRQFVLDRIRHHMTSRDARQAGYAAHTLRWWSRHLGRPLSSLAYVDTGARNSIRNFCDSARVLAHSRMDSICRVAGWLSAAA